MAVFYDVEQCITGQCPHCKGWFRVDIDGFFCEHDCKQEKVKQLQTIRTLEL